MANKKQKLTGVDCSKLSVGLVVQNYKQLCGLLGENTMDGDSKTAQQKRWRRYFDYEQEGWAYIIKEIYEMPEPVMDARKLKPGVYVQFIECLLIDYLSKSTKDAVVLSKTRWCYAIGLMNNEYYRYSSRDDRLLNVDSTLYIGDNDHDRFSPLKKIIAYKYGLSVNDNEIAFFYDVSVAKMYDLMNDALKSMERRNLIECTKLFVVYMEDGSEITIESNNDKLYSEIFYLRQMACRILGVSNFDAVRKTHQLNKFYGILQSLVKKYHTNKDDPSKSWVCVREFTKIFFVQNRMKKMLLPSTEKLLQLVGEEYGTELRNCRKELNHNVANKVGRIMSAKKSKRDKERREREEIGWGEEDPSKIPSYVKFDNSVLDKEDFLKIQTSLINYLIDDDD